MDKLKFDIKLSNGLNVTENKLYEAMISLGLNPHKQYVIGKMTVDFAFPKEKLVIEINGPYHNTKKQRLIDKKRWFVLKNNGWSVKTFKSKTVYEKPDSVAYVIKKVLNDIENTNILHKFLKKDNSFKSIDVKIMIFIFIIILILLFF